MSGPEHRIIPSDYPDDGTFLHIIRFEDGDYGIAVSDSERWPMGGFTLCASGGRNLAAWHAAVALFNSAKPVESLRDA